MDSAPPHPSLGSDSLFRPDANNACDVLENISRLQPTLPIAAVTQMAAEQCRLTMSGIRPYLNPSYKPVRKTSVQTRERIRAVLEGLFIKIQRDPFELAEFALCDTSELCYLAEIRNLPLAQIARFLELPNSQYQQLVNNNHIKVNQKQWGLFKKLLTILRDPSKAKELSFPKAPPTALVLPAHPLDNPLIKEILTLNPSIGISSLSREIQCLTGINLSVIQYYLYKKGRNPEIEAILNTALEQILNNLVKDPFCVNGFARVSIDPLIRLLQEKKIPFKLLVDLLGWTDSQKKYQFPKKQFIDMNRSQYKRYLDILARIENDEAYCEQIRKKGRSADPSPEALPNFEDSEDDIGLIDPENIASTDEFPYGWGSMLTRNGAGGKWKRPLFIENLMDEPD